MPVTKEESGRLGRLTEVILQLSGVVHPVILNAAAVPPVLLASSKSQLESNTSTPGVRKKSFRVLQTSRRQHGQHIIARKDRL